MAISSVSAATAADDLPDVYSASFPLVVSFHIALTPGGVAARRVDADNPACAYGDVSYFGPEHAGGLISYEYFAAPVVLSGASSREMRLPKSGVFQAEAKIYFVIQYLLSSRRRTPATSTMPA